MADAVAPVHDARGAPTPPSSEIPLTVVVVAFHRKEFVLPAVISAGEQTLSRDHFEILVLKNFADPTVDRELELRGVSNLPMTGTDHGAWVAAALERGRGQVFVFLDDDDLFLPPKLATVWEEFQRTPTLGYYHNGYRPLGADGARDSASSDPVLGAKTPSRIAVGEGDRTPEAVDALWRSGTAFNLSSIAVRRPLLESSLGYLRRIRLSTSAFLYFAALTSPCAIVSEASPLTVVRTHAGNVSGSFARTPEERWRREIRRAPRLSEDCDVMLEMLASRGAGQHLGRPLQVAKRRNQLLGAVGASPFSRATVVARMLSLLLGSGSGQLAASRPHLRVGLTSVLHGNRSFREP